MLRHHPSSQQRRAQRRDSCRASTTDTVRVDRALRPQGTQAVNALYAETGTVTGGAPFTDTVGTAVNYTAAPWRRLALAGSVAV